MEPADAAALRQLRINRTQDGQVPPRELLGHLVRALPPEFPELMAMHRMYRLRDFEVVTVAANYPDEKADVLKWLQKNQAITKNLLFADTDKYELMEAFEPTLDGRPALHHPPRPRGRGRLQEGRVDRRASS